MFYLRMFIAGIIPVLLTILFKFLEAKTKFGKINKTVRQVIIGICYGIIACLATQYGVPKDGYVTNVRSASPLTAGLVFGGPAGIIAGIMGGIYRWVSIYWGVGTYTVIACSVATVLAGFLGTWGHVLFIAGKRNTWFYGVFIAIATEVFHMLLVFVTHMDGIPQAFAVVTDTAISMIVANAISVMCSLIVRELFKWQKHKNDESAKEKRKAGIRLAPSPKNNNDINVLPAVSQDYIITPKIIIDEPQEETKGSSTVKDFLPKKEDISKKKLKTLFNREGLKTSNHSITQTFSVLLLVAVVVLFFATSLFTYFLQSNVSDLEVEELLSMNVSDVTTDFQKIEEKELLSKTNSVKDEFEKLFDDVGYVPSQNDLINRFSKEENNYCVKFQVDEISIIGLEGKVLYSSDDFNVGYDMSLGQQSQEFLCLLNGQETFVQNLQTKNTEQDRKMKYAGVVLEAQQDTSGNVRFEGGFIQIGYSYDRFMNSVKTNLSDLANNRHIGQKGFLFIISSQEGDLISAPEGMINNDLAVEFSKTLSSRSDNQVNTYTNAYDEEYYYYKTTIEGYTFVGCVPKDEAIFSRDIAVYIGAFMQLVVFFALFLIVYVLLKKIIVDNVHKINSSLSEITAGNLDTKVDIKGNEEFISLSTDINSTVDKLKEYISEAEKRIDMELHFAKSIQESVLPSVFPPYPNRNEFDIFASMDAAKEVGGDFYDLYLLDENHLVFLVADVSGKGIPAAMFMMNVKSLISGLTGSGLSVAEVFTKANDKICSSNDAGMFVTAWMGILDLETGVVKYVNAGHNPPLIKKKDGSYEYLKSRHGLVLAGMEGFPYKENEVVLNPGDEIFLYTDGVTEATNKDTKLFGEDKLLEVLNNNKNVSATNLCKAVKDSIDEFVGEAPQFDDITMLSLKYLKKASKIGGNQFMKELSLEATIEHIETVTEFVDNELDALGCSPKNKMQINIAIDELFGNIAHYAYHPGKGNAIVRVEVEKDPLSIIITFIDEGIPFDPLAKSDPNTTASAEEREIGGLGIFMVKKTMDGIKYVYEDGKNILQIKKQLN